jgi:hypothetical protein
MRGSLGMGRHDHVMLGDNDGFLPHFFNAFLPLALALVELRGTLGGVKTLGGQQQPIQCKPQISRFVMVREVRS